MGAENCVEDAGEEGNRSLGKLLQYPVRYTVRARSLADLENTDGFVNLVRVVNWDSLAGLKKKELSATSTVQISDETE